MTSIPPLNFDQQRVVIARTAEWIGHAGQIFNRTFEIIPVYFDLKGRTAGMYRIRKNQSQIHYNTFIFSKYFEDNLSVTVPHEVAHYIMDMVYDHRNIRPHGAEWKHLMARFRADSRRTCNYDFSGIPMRSTRRHAYSCECSTHQLTSVRHNRVQQGLMRYICRICRGELINMN